MIDDVVDAVGDVLHPNQCTLHRAALDVHDDALDAHVTLLDELDQRLAVVVPLLGQTLGRRKFVAAEFERDLERVRGKIVEVLHAARHRVPLGAVGDAALLAKVLVHVAAGAVLRHVTMVGRIGARQVSVLCQFQC